MCSTAPTRLVIQRIPTPSLAPLVENIPQFRSLSQTKVYARSSTAGLWVIRIIIAYPASRLLNRVPTKYFLDPLFCLVCEGRRNVLAYGGLHLY